MADAAKRAAGRPRGDDVPAIDYDRVEQILVYGEEVAGGDGKTRRVFPTYRQLAARFGVAHSLIATFAKRNACLERRRQRYPDQPASRASNTRTARRPAARRRAASAPASAGGDAGDLPEEPRRPRGRPRRIDSPQIPYDELDRALVFGELRPSLGGAGQLVVFPSVGELAERYGVAPSLISKYATEHNCKQRRDVAQFRVQARVDEKLIEMNADVIADVKAELRLTAAEVLRQFRERLREGAVRLDDPSTFNTIGRFLLLLEGEAEGRQEVALGLSLADLEARHRKVVEEARRFSPLEAGIEDAQLAPPVADHAGRGEADNAASDAAPPAAAPPLPIRPDDEGSN